MTIDPPKHTRPLAERQLAILEELSSTILLTESSPVLAETMLDLALEYTGATKGTFMALTDGDDFSILGCRGFDRSTFRSTGTRLDGGIAGMVAREQQAVMVADIAQDPRFTGFTRSSCETNSFISCPVICRGRVLGVITINDKADATPFTDDDFRLARGIAGQAAIYLENALLVTQLQNKATELEEINRKLIESDEEKTEFLARVSHELRTPLNSIKGSIYHLQTSPQLPRWELEEFFRIIAIEADKLSNIIENQLDFLRLGEDALLISKSVIRLRDLLEEAAHSRLITDPLARKNIRLQLLPGQEPGEVVGDRARVGQLLVNLIDGLASFLSPGDAMELSLQNGGKVRLMVTLPRELPQAAAAKLFTTTHLYQPGEQPDRLKLFLARKIVEDHGWEISAANSSAGFSVTISIPSSYQMKSDALLSRCLTMSADLVAELMGVDVCSVMLPDSLSGDLLIKGARGVDREVVKRTRIRPGDRISGWVALEGKPLLISDITTDSRFECSHRNRYGATSLISLPLATDTKVLGVLNLTCKRTGDPFTEKDLAVAATLGNLISSLVVRFTSGTCSTKEQERFANSFELLLAAGRNCPKKGGRMGTLVADVMERLEAHPEDRDMALFASLVYDLGLASLGEQIRKETSLKPQEVRAVRKHPAMAVTLLDHVDPPDTVKRAILHHHENFDGSGYPDHLKGEEIPLISRVLGVLDSFCAMTSPRPFRPPLSEEQALQELRDGSGTRYDPAVVSALEGVMGVTTTVEP